MKNIILFKQFAYLLSKLSQFRIWKDVVFNSLRQATIVLILLTVFLGLLNYLRGLSFDTLDFAIASLGFLLMFIRSLMEGKFGKVWK